jgi:hypothetical protein
MKTLQLSLVVVLLVSVFSCSKKNDPMPTFDITSATQRFVKVNGCQNGNSLFEISLFYTSSRDLNRYYVDLSVNYLFANGQSGNYRDNTAQWDGRKLTAQSCTGFGNNNYIDLTINALLFEQDVEGNKVGNAIAMANPVTVRLLKPSGSN